MTMRLRIFLAASLVLAACTAGGSSRVTDRAVVDETIEVPPSPSRAETPEQPEERNKWVTERPKWLGKKPLPLGPTGMGIAEPTPPILRNRRFATIDILPRPEHRGYRATIGPVTQEVLERSSWKPKCPVQPEDLAYLTMTFWGFDRERHTGEMMVHRSIARDTARVFERIYKARFPIEEMRVPTLQEQRQWHTAPTGDSNITSSFECRDSAEGSSWSEHAYGLAIDINPFHNPYLRGDVIGPELAAAYTNRDWKRPGMIYEGDAVVSAFDAIGWGWGGRWNSLKDWMHFSRSGR